MRKMRKFLNILFLCTLALGLSSCEPDDGEDYYIYDTLAGRYLGRRFRFCRCL